MVQARRHRPTWARLVVAALTMALLLAGVSSVAAAGRERVGDRISLFDPLTTYPADTAFHIWHGFIFEQGVDRGYGRNEFQLDVDGVTTTADFTDVDVLDPRVVSRVWVFNFPEGLTGTHTFTGHWMTPDGEDIITVTVDFT
jgi:hypothetical protein